MPYLLIIACWGVVQWSGLAWPGLAKFEQLDHGYAPPPLASCLSVPEEWAYCWQNLRIGWLVIHKFAGAYGWEHVSIWVQKKYSESLPNTSKCFRLIVH